MDSIRSLANDVNHDEVKVALKVREAPAAGQTATTSPCAAQP